MTEGPHSVHGMGRALAEPDWLVAHIAPAWTFWALAVGIMALTTLAQLFYYRRRGWI